MKSYLLIILFAISTLRVNAQEAVITLEEPLNGNETHVFVARDEVRMTDGFSYSPGDPPPGVDPYFFRAYTNEDMVLPVNYADEPIVVEDRVLNTDLPVGTTAGSHSVSLTGAATYQVPILIPPGTAGMEPSVSVVYNSQAGNGLLGYGWNIAGLSAITRIGHTIYHDGQVKGVNFDDDRFAMDGNRLILISEHDYGDDGSIYYTENFNASRITAHGSATGGGPLYFTVETKDGKIIEYGNTDNSRVETVSSMASSVITWNINKITDKMGNYIEFEYHKSWDHTQYWIEEINYTGNESANLSPYNSIHFYYSERTDKRTTYIAGSELQSNVLLEHIKVFSGNSLVRNYKFGYHYDLYSRLIQIKEFNGQGQRYNSTVFEWYPSTNSEQYLAFDLLESDAENKDSSIVERTAAQLDSSDRERDYTYEYFTGDYNGDGKSDILQIEYSKEGNTITTQKWTLYANEQVGNNPLFAYYIDSVAVKEGEIVEQAVEFAFGDLNGDGLSDVLQLDNTGSLTQPSYELVCYFSKPDDVTYAQFFIGGINLGVDYGIIFSMDIIEVNGDGQADILLYCKPHNQDKVKPFVLISDGTYSNPYAVNYTGSVDLNDIVTIEKDKISFGDFNADGKNEIMVLDESGSGYEIFYYNESSNTMESFSSGSSPNVNCSIFTGDFNGDGNSDLLYFNESQQWKIGINSGVAFTEINAPISSTQNPDDDYVNYITADFDGDGKDDIWEAYYDYSTLTNQTNIYYSKEFSFESYSFTFDEGLGRYADNYSLADWNGDGKTDIFTHIGGADPHIWAIHFSPTKPKPHLLHTIADGVNNRIDVNYKPLTYGGELYVKHNNSFVLNLQELIDFQGAFYVTSYSIFDLEEPDQRTISYSYEGAKIHKFGRGFLGFSKVISHDLTEDLKKVNSYHTIRVNNYRIRNGLNFLYYSHVLNATSVYVPSTNLISETTYINQFKNEYDEENIISLSFVHEATSIDYLKNEMTITTTQTVDDYGNILTQSIDHHGEGTTQTTTTYTDKGSWCDYLTKHITVTKERNGEEDFTGETDYDYYDNGLLHVATQFDDLDNPIHETYEYYDYFGTVEYKTRSATGETDRTVSYVYDSKHRFVTEKTNILDQTSFFTYDHRTGNLLNSTNIQDLETTYRYDGFGRKKRVNYPDGTATVFSRHWNQDGDILYFTEQQTTGGPLQRTYFDRLGRTIIDERQDLTTSMVRTKTIYDANGRVHQVSEPYYANDDPSQWTTFHYDELGRTEQVDYPTHTETTVYDGTTTTVTNTSTGVEKSVTTDAFGLTVSVTDPTGTIEYEYFSHGKPRAITAPDGSVFSITYDDYLRQKTLEDPDAGMVNYEEYTGFGELKRQEHEGRTTETDYDDYGRPDIVTYTYEDETETVDYDYVEEGNGLGQVKTITHSNGIANHYTYDRLGRLKTEQEVVDGQAYQTGYDYNGQGQLYKLTYPSGFVLNHEYDIGIVNKLYYNNNQSNTLYELPAYNVRGQLTDFEYGNGLATSLGYDELGFPDFLLVESGSTLSMNYGFDPGTGNLNWRNENTDRLDLHENFGYDISDLKNRLTDWGENDQGQLSILYSDNGNMSYKTDVTDQTEQSFKYDPDHPHAVSRLDNVKTDYLEFVEEQDQVIVYNTIDKTKSIEQANKRLEFVYGPGQSRKIMKTFAKESGDWILKKTKYYILGNTEIEIDETTGETRTLNYIAGKAILVQTASGDNLYYLHKDYQGTTLAVTDEDGDAIQRYAYDPWGRRRNPTTWANLTASEIAQQDFLFARGYTGHEHLDDFGLINMNGRMYDPLLGRMLSPDNYVQAPDNSQNFNRYSYAMNNPLVYTDPDGEFVFLVPNIGLSKEGGLSLGVSLVFGIPGFASFQIGGGYSFQGQEPYAYAGASAGFNTVYTSITPSGGASVGYSFGMSPYTGFPVSSNAFTAGVDYNISNRSWSANVSSWYINNNELTFNPSISAMLFPEQTTNLIRGHGFRTNSSVFDRMMSVYPDISCNEILDYFGFEGKYDPEYIGPGTANEITGAIRYGDEAFSYNYDYLSYVASEEMFHRRDVLRGNYEDVDWDDNFQAQKARSEGEYKANKFIYRNQGIFKKTLSQQKLANNINAHGLMLDKSFQIRTYHAFYKIYRLW